MSFLLPAFEIKVPFLRMNELVPKLAARTVGPVARTIVVPVTIAAVGDHAARSFLEFFAATSRGNPLDLIERNLIAGAV